ncbi:hypothetical protein DRW03_29515 [Corallococcus sp. H22C18031201]|uniref:hypothetical protein n=1 Tax=Citreicoccus inhibens TaxID=2849499 RepID=UPI000E74C601|nr:hypothetical protein [Citreicoccus inhibens]MBU8897408.1 hypothetical protein [Citreicoccus inhibens]RJS16878.1 hypothetical protein DRW03_29515 [Corallococcus sp. H22C18031201]
MSRELDVARLELPRDEKGFVRRECPACGRTFKTRPSRHDAHAVHRRLTSLFPFENAHESGDSEGPPWCCLYCGHKAPTDSWLTTEQHVHVERVARAWANHVRYEQLAHVTRTLSQNPRPTFVVVPPEDLPGPMPPDSESLRVIPMVCCGEDVQALWEWDSALYCPRCGAHHGGLSGRQQIHLRFIQE